MGAQHIWVLQILGSQREQGGAGQELPLPHLKKQEILKKNRNFFPLLITCNSTDGQDRGLENRKIIWELEERLARSGVEVLAGLGLRALS